MDGVGVGGGIIGGWCRGGGGGAPLHTNAKNKGFLRSLAPVRVWLGGCCTLG